MRHYIERIYKEQLPQLLHFSLNAGVKLTALLQALYP